MDWSEIASASNNLLALVVDERKIAMLIFMTGSKTRIQSCQRNANV